MNVIAMDEIILLMSGAVFLLGLITFCTGIFILVARAAGKSTKEITRQTANMAQKGITDDIAGLVGNASILISELNQLVRTTAGIGVFLVFVGLTLIATSYILVLKLSQF
jgi:hypothetical protein